MNVDYDSLPTECFRCKKPIPYGGWITAIGKVGGLSTILKNQVIFICGCGHKMYSGVCYSGGDE